MNFPKVWQMVENLKTFTPEEVAMVVEKVVEENNKQQNIELLLSHLTNKNKFAIENDIYMTKVNEIQTKTIKEIKKLKEKEEKMELDNNNNNNAWKVFEIQSLLNYLLKFLASKDIAKLSTISSNWVIAACNAIEQNKYLVEIDHSEGNNNSNLIPKKNVKLIVYKLVIDHGLKHSWKYYNAVFEKSLNVLTFFHLKYVYLSYLEFEKFVQWLSFKIEYDFISLIHIWIITEKESLALCNYWKPIKLKGLCCNNAHLFNNIIKINSNLKSIHIELQRPTFDFQQNSPKFAGKLLYTEEFCVSFRDEKVIKKNILSDLKFSNHLKRFHIATKTANKLPELIREVIRFVNSYCNHLNQITIECKTTINYNVDRILVEINKLMQRLKTTQSNYLRLEIQLWHCMFARIKSFQPMLNKSTLYYDMMVSQECVIYSISNNKNRHKNDFVLNCFSWNYHCGNCQCCHLNDFKTGDIPIKL